MLHHGDCLDVMAGMDPDSVDAIVTDPPYGIRFMGKAWDAFDIEKMTRKAAESAKSLGPVSRGGGKRTVSAFGNRAGKAGAYDFTLRGNRAFQDFTTGWAEAAYLASPSRPPTCSLSVARAPSTG
jgi:DNA modification methylase